MLPWILLILLFVLILIDIPIAFALGIVAIIALIVTGYPLSIVPLILADSLISFVLLAVPLFIATGEIMTRGQVSEALVEVSSSLVGFIRGGLAHVNIFVSMLFANISGSAVADAASLGSILIPEMEKRGYPKDFSVAVTSTSASIGILIPPSIAMILYAVVADVSVARMFLAGFIPGSLYGFSLMIGAYIIARRRKYPSYEPFSLSNVVRKGRRAVWATIIPIVILGGILTGVCTTTEAAGLAAMIALCLALFVYKGIRINQVPSVLLSCSKRAGAVLMIMSTSMVLSWYLIREGIPQALAAWMGTLTSSTPLVILILIIFISLCGVILHGASMMLMLVPVLLPLTREFGIDPIHFGVLFTMGICVGEQTPPVASVLLVTTSVAHLPIVDSLRALLPFFLILVANTFLVAYVPFFSLFLPNLVLGPP
ncbi:MAG: TRAP transporter large permease [Candidatus Hodarchaeota archaeon]